MKRIRIPFLAILVVLTIEAECQFTNRYPKLDGFRQQIYIEGFDLPIFSTKPIYFAASTVKNRFAFCLNGKVIISTETGKIIPIYNDGAIDFQPRWNNDGTKIAFTRDNGNETFIVLYDFQNAEQRIFHRSGKMDLDPYFTKDGNRILFASSSYGSFDIFSKTIHGSDLKRITTFSGCELSPVPINDDSIVFLSKTQFGDDQISLYSIKQNQKYTLKAIKFIGACKLDIALGRYLIYSWPEEDAYSLKLISIANPEFEFTLAKQLERNFLYPTFNPNDSSVYYSEFSPSSIRIKKSYLWEIGDEEVTIPEVRLKNYKQYKFHFNNLSQDNYREYFKISIKDMENNYYFPKDVINVWADPNLGDLYCYSPLNFTIELPSNKKFILNYSSGLEFFTQKFDPLKNLKDTTNLDYKINWNQVYLDHTFYSGDNHFHLNIGGQYNFNPASLKPVMGGEYLQFCTPLIANFGNRVTDLGFFKHASMNFVFGQEVRSHFHGHLSLMGGNELFFPQFWGPFYELFDDFDFSNNVAIKFGNKHSLISTYVHHTFVEKPFDPINLSKSTYDIFQNSINTEGIGIELVNIWSDEIGSQEIFESILNIGSDIFLNAGTDAFPNVFRTPPVGATRIFTHSKKSVYNYNDYIEDISSGNSFVTNGPLLLFSVENFLPGMVIQFKDTLTFSSDILSYSDTISLEILVNSNVVFKKQMTGSFKFQNMSGKFKCPEKGWISARLISKRKPIRYSDSYSYAYTSPIWINKRNSIPNDVRLSSSKKLLDALEKNRKVVLDAYRGKASTQINEIDNAINILKRRIEEMSVSK